jgi:hypothetical protein
MAETGQTIEIDRRLVIDAAAWLYAFDEMVTAVEETSPTSIGDAFTDVAWTLTKRLLGVHGQLDAEDEDWAYRHPEVVEINALARERGAEMLRAALHSEHGSVLKGNPAMTNKGLRQAAIGLEMYGALTRDSAQAHPYFTGPPSSVKTLAEIELAISDLETQLRNLTDKALRLRTEDRPAPRAA